MVRVSFVTMLAVLAAIMVITVHAKPADNPNGKIKIVKQNQIQDETSYKLEFENSDGQIRHESGDVRDEKEGGIFVVGQYSYVGTDNKLYTVRYEAGKDGYKPTLTVTDL